MFESDWVFISPQLTAWGESLLCISCSLSSPFLVALERTVFSQVKMVLLVSALCPMGRECPSALSWAKYTSYQTGRSVKDAARCPHDLTNSLLITKLTLAGFFLPMVTEGRSACSRDLPSLRAGEHFGVLQCRISSRCFFLPFFLKLAAGCHFSALHLLVWLVHGQTGSLSSSCPYHKKKFFQAISAMLN